MMDWCHDIQLLLGSEIIHILHMEPKKKKNYIENEYFGLVSINFFFLFCPII